MVTQSTLHDAFAQVGARLILQLWRLTRRNRDHRVRPWATEFGDTGFSVTGRYPQYSLQQNVRLRLALALKHDDSRRKQSNQKTMNMTSIALVVGLIGLTVSELSGADQRAPESKPIIIDQAPSELRDVAPRLWTVVFSPDGKTLAVTAGWDNPKEPGELVLWDLDTRQTRLIWRQEATIRTASFSGDGKSLAVGDFAGTTRVLDPTTGQVIRTMPEHAKLVNSVTFTPDNKTLVTASFDETIKLWDVVTGKEQHVFSLPGEGIVKVAISSDNRKLAAGTWPGKVHVWDLTKREELHVLEASLDQPGGTKIAEAVAFAPDGKSLVTGSWDRTLRLWDVATGKTMRDLVGHQSSVQSAEYSPNGRTLASGDARGTVMLWNVATGQQLATLRAHNDRCFGLAFSPDGKFLATAGWDRVVKIWDLETREPVATLARQKG